ncbi:unnamed protein product [Urochloa humidicola]
MSILIEQRSDHSAIHYLDDPSPEDTGNRELHEVLQRLSKSVVSLYTSKNGKDVCDEFTGIVITSNIRDTCILTSASPIRNPEDPTKLARNLSIYVNLPNGKSAKGCLKVIDYESNTITVRIRPSPDFQEASLDPIWKVGPDNYVKALPDFPEASLDHIPEVGSDCCVAALCCSKTRVGFSSGVVTETSEEYKGQKLIVSTCQIPKFGIGGPLVDSEGNFVGINMHRLEVGTLFLPKKKVLDSFLPYTKRFRISQASREICKSSTNIPEGSTSEKRPDTGSTSEKKSDTGSRFKKILKRFSSSTSSDSETDELQDIEKLTSAPCYRPLPKNEFTKELIEDLSSHGYPLPLTLEGGMHLRNGFEEEFPGDTWNELTEKVASSLSLSVVSLASYLAGEKTRFFACTGVIIGHIKSMTKILTSASLVTVDKKIDENLKIQVLLPTNKHAEGKLQHYDLRYNVVVVTITGFHCRRTAKLHSKGDGSSTKVVGIGRIFETGELMATSGVLTDNSSKLASEDNGTSTCKITVAGIGGPLISHNGNFIGMNFYGAKETPYVPRYIIQKLLNDFDGKGYVAADGRAGKRKKKNRADYIIPDRWSVPRPYWYYPSLVPRRIWGRRRYN